MSKPGWTYWFQALTTPGVAWVNLTLALALHVLDEAAHDFLSYYNPAARAIGERLSAGVPPTFTSDVWLSGLIVGLILLLALSPFAFRCARLPDAARSALAANAKLSCSAIGNHPPPAGTMAARRAARKGRLRGWGWGRVASGEVVAR